MAYVGERFVIVGMAGRTDLNRSEVELLEDCGNGRWAVRLLPDLSITSRLSHAGDILRLKPENLVRHAELAA